MIKLLELANILENYRLINTKRYGMSHNTQKHLLHKQFVALHRNGCSIAPLNDYINKPIYQELTSKAEYFREDSDK